MDLRTLQEGFIPLLPYFAERRDNEPIARMAVELDNMFVDLLTGEAVEDDLKALIEAMPNPTVGIPGLTEPPHGSTSSSVVEVSMRPVSGTVRWPLNAGAGRVKAAYTALGAVPA